MGEVTYLASKINTSVNEIWQLPHSHFMAYMKHSLISDLRQTEEGQEILDKFNRYMNPQTDADLGTIRQLAGYTSQQERG